MIYRQRAYKLRIHRREGGERESIRPRVEDKDGRWRYLDEDNPTLIELDERDLVDIDALLASGAIVPYAAPKAVKRGKEASP